MDEMLRHRIGIHGVMQGAGFRPYISKLAIKCSLSGFVRNQESHVLIEAQGSQIALHLFLDHIRSSGSTVSKLSSLAVSSLEPCVGESGFSIRQSRACSDNKTAITPDLAICQKCLLELMDEKRRHYFDPFVTCTQCGPRQTMVSDLPYDRQNTSMARLTMCEACCKEYEDSDNRRFHSQSLSCLHCDPHLTLLDSEGLAVPGNAAATIHAAAIFLQQGSVLAMKGLGGFQFICDASNEHSVNALRQRKDRCEKPFALMEISTERLIADYEQLFQIQPFLIAHDLHPLLERSLDRLKSGDSSVYTHTRLPPHDGGLCFKQLAVAHASLANKQSKSEEVTCA